MSLFLTGATGFIGSHVLRQLLARGEEVIVLSRQGKDNVHLRELADRPFEVVQGDLLKPESYLPALERCQRVIHIAGWISTRRRDFAALRAANVEATEALWKLCAKTRPQRIVYLASIFAHGWGPNETPCDETTAFDPAIAQLEVPYFVAKREAELMSWSWLERKKLPIIFGYPGYCLGPGDYYLSSMRVISQYLKGMLPGYLNGGMNFIDVRDAAAGLVGCLDKGRVGEKYMIGDHNLRWRDFFARLAAVSGRRAPMITLPYGLTRALGSMTEAVWANGPLTRGDAGVMGHIWFYDSSKARRELALPSRPLEESLRDGIAWLKEAKL